MLIVQTFLQSFKATSDLELQHLHHYTASLAQSTAFLLCSQSCRPTDILENLMYQLAGHSRTLHVSITPHLLSNPISFLGIDNSIRILFTSKVSFQT